MELQTFPPLLLFAVTSVTLLAHLLQCDPSNLWHSCYCSLNNNSLRVKGVGGRVQVKVRHDGMEWHGCSQINGDEMYT